MGGFALNRNVPGRVQTNAGGTGFKLNSRPKDTVREGDEMPGSYAPGGSPASTTNTAGSGGGATSTPGTGGGGGAGGGSGPGMTNTAQANPDMEAALKAYRDRIAQEQAREGATDPLLLEQVQNLRDRRSADQTQRATDQAGSQIRDFAAGQKAISDERAARSGRSQGFQDSGIDEAAQRAQAGAAAKIQMNEEQRLDNLVLGGQAIMSAPAQEALQREAGVTGLISGQMGQAGAGANLALNQQQLALQQQAQQQNQALEQQRLQMQQQAQQQQMLMEMLRSGGY